MASDLRHKTPEQLRAEIVYQDGKLAEYDTKIQQIDVQLQEAKALAEELMVDLSNKRMRRNNHHQRRVWAKNYLIMKGEDV